MRKATAPVSRRADKTTTRVSKATAGRALTAKAPARPKIDADPAALSQTLGWSHFVELLPIKDSLARDFYAEMCRIERWDVRTLRQKIGGMLFQRNLRDGVTRVDGGPCLAFQAQALRPA